MKKITKKDKRACLIQACHRTAKEIQNRLMSRMSRIHVSPRTHVGETFIGRNEPCYCGSGLKFKHCCWAKHATVKAGSMTPEMAEYIQKQDNYFDKKQGRKDAKQ